MAGYKPESRDKIKRGLTDHIRKTDDRSKHIGYIVKDAKAIADASKIIRTAATTEFVKQGQEAFKKAGSAVKKEFLRQGKDLAAKVKKLYATEQKLRTQTQDSNMNARGLAAASSSIKETSAAKDNLNRGKTAALKDAGFTNTERNRANNHKNRTEKQHQAHKYQLGLAKLYLSPGSTKLREPTPQLREISGAIHNIKNEALEGKILSVDRDRQKRRKPTSKQIKELEQALNDAELQKERGMGERHTQSHIPEQQDNANNPAYGPPLGNEYKRDKS